MHQADVTGINPDVTAVPMSKREAIWKAMEGRNDLANLASGILTAFWDSAWRASGWCLGNTSLRQRFATVQGFRVQG